MIDTITLLVKALQALHHAPPLCLHSDNGIGRYRFVGCRGSSVVDYVLSSQELFRFIKDFEVQEPNILSDHCLINFSFEFGSQPKSTQKSEENELITGKYVWKNDLKNDFLDSLGNQATSEKLAVLNDKISSCSDDNDVNACVSDFTSIIEEASTPHFKKISQSTKNASRNDFFPIQKKIHSIMKSAMRKKYYFLHKLDTYRKINSDENRISMVKARSDYKALLRKRRFDFDKEKTNKFLSAKNKNAKLYWNMLKELSHVKPANIALSAFEEYFKSVNNPSDPFYSPDEAILYFNERYVNNEFNIMFEDLNLNFSEDEILRSIKQLKTNKSGGPDRIINEFFYPR